MAARSARRFLTEKKTVSVSNVEQISEDLAVISFVEENVRLDDLYNVPNPRVMVKLLLRRAGHKVSATLAPDSSNDGDGHPECVAAF